MIVLILFAVCVTLIYRYTTRNHDYWAKRKVKHDRPLPFFGNHLQNFLVRRTTPEIGLEMYNKYKDEKIVGYYRGNTPELIIRDPEIVKHILSVDFKNFSSRGGFENTVKDPLLHSVIFMNVEQWRTTRQQLTPCISKSKLRGMFPLVVKCIEKLESTIEDISSRDEVVSTNELMTEYLVECIGSCCFGIELDTISTRSKFCKLAKNFFNKTKWQVFLMALVELLPDVTSLWTPKIVTRDLESVFLEMTRKIREGRNLKPSGRNDVMDMLLEIEAQEKFCINDDFQKSLKGNPNERELEANLYFVAAQLFLFFIAGFETTATTMSTTLHQLAYHPEVQEKIQEEIDQVLTKYENRFTFECLDELTQLDLAIKESMRLLSPIGSMRRTCSASYNIPGTDVTIDSGVRILIPVQALHRDQEYFEYPGEFRPERFSPEAGKLPANFTYMAFGEGPRKCIGSRIALMMTLAGLATILRRFTVVPAPTSNYRQTLKKNCYLTQIVDGGFPLKFIPRK